MSLPSSLRLKTQPDQINEKSENRISEKLPSSLKPKQTKEDKEKEERKKLYEQSGFGEEKTKELLGQKPSKEREFYKTLAKGTIEGVSKLGRMMGPLHEYPDAVLTGKKSQISPEEQTEVLDELLPTEDTFVQRGLRRGSYA